MFDQQSKWNVNWKEIRDYINPYLGSFKEEKPNAGERRDFSLINTTALQASNTFAAGMHNGITSPTRPWMKLGIPDPDIAEQEGVRWWCDDTTQLMLSIFGRSNFYREAHKFYKELGVFGTAVMFIVPDAKTVIRCKTLTIGQYAIGVDHTGRVTRFTRLLRMTVAEMVDMFGIDNVPGDVKAEYENKQFDGYKDVYHLILPNKDRVEGKIDKWSMPFISYYWSQGCDTDHYLEIGGFEEFPVMCARWDTNGSDIYGYGPGWYALGDGKSVQNVDSDIHEGVEKGVNPPMVAPSDVLSAGGVNTHPKGVTFYQREAGGNEIREAFQMRLNIADAVGLLDRKENVINKHFFVDLFRMLEGIDNGNITAREIIERVQEKMSLIGPALDNLQSEFLANVIDRVFGIISRAGLAPTPDESVAELLSGQDLKVEYISVMAQAQKMNGLSSLEQLAAFVGNLAGANPDVLDKFDMDEAVDKYAESIGTPVSVVRSDEKVAQIRQQKQEQMQQQQQMMAAQAATQGANTLANTPVGTGSALDALIPGLGGGLQ